MNVDEWAKTMQQISREREALNASYDELQRRMAVDAEEVTPTAEPRPKEELIPELIQLTMQFGNFVNFEREHADKLYVLLLDALRRLAEAHEIELYPGWPFAADPPA